MEHELKLTFDQRFNLRLQQQLSMACLQDPSHNKNKVNSIYFDTPSFDLLAEKASSDYLKTKLRLRWYDDINQQDEQLCFLELKEKVGSSRNKHRLKIILSRNCDIYHYIQSNEFAYIKRQFIQKYSPNLSKYELSPHALISYQRTRLIDKFSQDRISVDTQIIGSSFLNKQITKLQQSVFEIKGKNLYSLPENLRFLMHFDLKKAAFSKYYECCSQLNHYTQ